MKYSDMAWGRVDFLGVGTMAGSRVADFSRRTFVGALGLGAGALVLRWFSGAIIPWRPGAPGAPIPRRAASLRVSATSAGLELRPLPLENDGPIFRLNETAAFIWDRADGSHTVHEIALLVSDEFTVTPARALRDTVSFLQSLSSAGLTFAFSG